MTFLLHLSRLDRNLILAVVVIAYGVYAVRIGAAVISNYVDPSVMQLACHRYLGWM